MKLSFILLSLSLSLSLFAQTKVELDAKKMSIDQDEAIVVRTNKTPNTVEITFRVPMDESYCQAYGTRMNYQVSGMHCGYDSHYRQVLVGSMCVRTIRNRTGGSSCARYENRYVTQAYQNPRGCMVAETFCEQTGIRTNYVSDKMTLKFKGLADLGDSESETFLISARQKRFDGVNVVYDIKPLETLVEYKVSQKKFLGLFSNDSYVVEEK